MRWNPDPRVFGIHYLQNETMFWASKGPIAGLEFVPKFKGWAATPTDEDDAIIFQRSQTYLNWLEDLFEEVRIKVRPEAPSRIGSLMLCPRFGEGFCSKPRSYSARTHVYEIRVTGKAYTTDSEMFTEARIQSARSLGRELHRWGDVGAMKDAEGTIRSYARSYWSEGLDRDDYIQEYFITEETLVDGEARIIQLMNFD
jgi:hypothetical protein